MIVLFDVDGVLADFVGGLCSELATRGYNYTPDDVKHWDLSLSFSPEAMDHVWEIMATEGFCATLRWYLDTPNFLRSLPKHVKVHAVTAPFRRGRDWMYERMMWLAPRFDLDAVHFVSGKYKHMLRGDVLVEDHPGTARDWLEAHPQGTAILIDRPWNQRAAKEYCEHERMVRAFTWGEVRDVISNIHR